jgi:hypothetical protein
MNSHRVFPFMLVLLVIAIICLNSCSEDCDPCGVSCPDYTADLIGLWITFEAYNNGVPVGSAVGIGFDFRSDDTLIVDGDTLSWFATSDRIIMTGIEYIGTLVMDYYFEADTLDMNTIAMGDTLRWRCLREEDMPPL